MKSTYAAPLFILASSASAREYSATIGSGPGPSSSDLDFRDANHHPNATKSVNFAVGNQKDWTFRVNITELSAPDANNIKDAKILNTVYDIQWPGSKDLNSTIEEATQSKEAHFCASIIFSGFPANVTNGWKDGSTSCSDAIGDSCLGALVAAYQADYPVDANSGNHCPSGVYPSRIPQCHGTFASDYEALGISLIDPGRNTTTNMSKTDTDTSAFPLKNGSGFAFSTSEAYDGNNRTLYEQADTRLHMVILSSESSIFPVCARINATELTKTSPGTAQPSDGAASSIMVNGQTGWLGAAAGMALVSYLI